MKTLQQKRKATYHTIRDYCVLALSMIVGAIGLYLFLQPNQIAMGGIVGIAQIVNWGTGVPVYYTYFALNFLLFLVALKILGWRFCAKTIFAVVVFTVASKILVIFLPPDLHLLADQKFMACMIGGIFMGVSVGLGLSSGGSTGGSDVVAAIVHKYRDVSLGRVILLCDMLLSHRAMWCCAIGRKCSTVTFCFSSSHNAWTTWSTCNARACCFSSYPTIIRR